MTSKTKQPEDWTRVETLTTIENYLADKLKGKTEFRMPEDEVLAMLFAAQVHIRRAMSKSENPLLIMRDGSITGLKVGDEGVLVVPMMFQTDFLDKLEGDYTPFAGSSPTQKNEKRSNLQLVTQDPEE